MSLCIDNFVNKCCNIFRYNFCSESNGNWHSLEGLISVTSETTIRQQDHFLCSYAIQGQGQGMRWICTF